MFNIILIKIIIELFCYEKYMKNTLEKTVKGNKVSKFIIFVIAFCFMTIFQSSYVAIVFIVFLVSLFIIHFLYSASFLTKLLIIVIYIEIGFIAKILYLTLVNFVDINSNFLFRYFLVSIIKYIIISFFCLFKSTKIHSIKKINFILSIILNFSVINCWIIFRICQGTIGSEMIFLCILNIFIMILSNYVIFYIYKKFNEIKYKNKINEQYIEKMKDRESYYEDIRQYNEYIQTVKHDLANQLGVLYDSIENSDDLAKVMIRELNFGLKSVDEKIYTKNVIVNAIVKLKFTLAKKHKIKIISDIRIPEKINMDYGDIGILLGNLLDNALEACDQVVSANSFIEIDIKYSEGNLLLLIKNSKGSKINTKLQTYKSDKKNHGRGIKSVKKIVNKYDGMIIFKDLGEVFKVSAIIYGV